jgi:ActR/RegA family two-component response regulator
MQPLCNRIRAAGVAVDLAVEARRALEIIRTEQYDGVAVDLLLSDRDGISFALELRRQQPLLGLLVLSTTSCTVPVVDGPDWLSQSSQHARLIFALKQATQRSAGYPLKILHIENDDRVARLVEHTIGSHARLFRVRSTLDANLSMSFTAYDLVLMGGHPLPDSIPTDSLLSTHTPVCVNTTNAEPLLSIFRKLRARSFIHEPAFC